MRHNKGFLIKIFLFGRDATARHAYITAKIGKENSMLRSLSVAFAAILAALTSRTVAIAEWRLLG